MPWLPGPASGGRLICGRCPLASEEVLGVVWGGLIAPVPVEGGGEMAFVPDGAVFVAVGGAMFVLTPRVFVAPPVNALVWAPKLPCAAIWFGACRP